MTANEAGETRFVSLSSLPASIYRANEVHFLTKHREKRFLIRIIFAHLASVWSTNNNSIKHMTCADIKCGFYKFEEFLKNYFYIMHLLCVLLISVVFIGQEYFLLIIDFSDVGQIPFQFL